MANEKDSLTFSPCDVDVWLQGCEDGCVWGQGKNSKLVSVEYPDNTIQNITTQYRNQRGQWTRDFVARDQPSSADNTVTFAPNASTLIKWLTRPQPTTIYTAYLNGNRYAYLTVSPRNIPKSEGGFKAYDSRETAASIKRPLVMTAVNGRYDIGLLEFSGNKNDSIDTIGTGAIFLPPVGGCEDGQCADPTKTYYEAHRRVNGTLGGNPYVKIVLDGVRQTNAIIDVALTTDNVVETPGVIVGDKIVIPFVNLTAPAHGYYYAQILASGLLGPWSRVAVGFGAQINAVSTDGSALYFSTEVGGGATGAIYVPVVGAGGTAVTNPATEPMLKIHTNDDVTLRGGLNLALLVTKPGDVAGRSVVFTTPTGATAASGDITSVCVVGANNWMIGTSQGRVFETKNAGASWLEHSYGGAANTDVSAIAASLDGQVRYIAQADKLWRNVTDGSQCGSAAGKGWSQSSWITNFPTDFGIIKAVVIPPNPDRFTQANVAFVSFELGSQGLLISGEPNLSYV